MAQTYINEIGRHLGEQVTIKGWLYNKRSSGKLGFLEIRDGSGLIQGVVSKKEVDEATWERVEQVTQESSVIVTGAPREHPKRPGVYELDISGLEIVQLTQDYPISPKEHGVEFLMDHRHLWLRSRRQHAILRVRHEIIRAVRDFFDNQGFVLCDTPVFTPAACEGTTTLFEVGYFDEKAYLTQSGQLYNEATAAAFGKAYCFGPTFRAEKSKTRRHLTEFWMVEPEVAYAQLDDVMTLAENFLSYVVGRVLENRRSELEELERDTSKLAGIIPPFPRLQYDEAVRLLQEAHAKGLVEHRFEWGGDLGSPDETYLSGLYDRPVMVHRYPAAIKAFYMEPDPERPDLALCVDVLAPEGYGEVIGGGERMSSHDLLLQRIGEHELPPEAFDWYLDLRKYGSVPHGGFGMGIERCVAWVCGLEHVRETIPF
ncbi:MAG: asparagine--tRNA ligase, partial [Acidobacteria bacterium]|nr:asparagine--tRNA ligase [Acidobacteriota bacterium]